MPDGVHLRGSPVGKSKIVSKSELRRIRGQKKPEKARERHHRNRKRRRGISFYSSCSILVKSDGTRSDCGTLVFYHLLLLLYPIAGKLDAFDSLLDISSSYNCVSSSIGFCSPP